MQSMLSRRHFFGGLAGIAATTAAGAIAAQPGANGAIGAPVVPNRVTPAALGPGIVLELTANDFVPLDSATFEYVIPGGLQVTEGDTFFYASLRLPVGTRILGARVYLNPNGAVRPVLLMRYRPLNPTVQKLAEESSSAGSAVEAIDLAVTHDIAAGWNYRLGEVRLAPGGAILYGGRVRYRLPV